MKKTIIGFVLAGLVTAGAFACNGGMAAWGYMAQWWNLAATLVYILFWAAFTAGASKCRPWLHLARVMAWITLVTGGYCLALRLLEAGGFLSALLSIFVSVPFYGFNIMLDWTAVYAVATALGLGWVLWTRKLAKQ